MGKKHKKTPPALKKAAENKRYVSAVHGNKIYYVNYSSTNTFRRMNTDGSGDELLYGTKVGSGQTTVYDGYVYFIADSDQLYRYRISDGTVEKFTDSKGTYGGSNMR